MKWKMNGLYALPLAAMTVAACGDKSDAVSTESASSKPAASGAKAVPTAPAKRAPVTLAQFTTEAPASACKTLVSCKNEEASLSVGVMLTMVAAFGGMEDPKISADMKAVGDAQKKDNDRQLLNASECTTVMGAVEKVIGFSAPKLQASLDAKKIEFNSDKASACLAALATEPAFCKDEKKVKAGLKLSDLDTLMKPYEKDIGQFLQSCEDAIVGKVPVGEACESDFECAGEKVSCKSKKCTSKTK